jgi:hypothetical protein
MVRVLMLILATSFNKEMHQTRAMYKGELQYLFDCFRAEVASCPAERTKILALPS